MPLWLIVLIVGLLVIGGGAVLAPTGLNEWLNDHRWVLPAVSLLLVVVISLVVGGFSGTIHDAQIGACERRNPEVTSEVENLEHDRTFLRAFRNLAKAVLPPASSEYDGIVTATTLAIERKSEAIGEKVAGRAQFAVHPGSVVIDCAAAYPSP
jgi:hypothetical protein